MKICQKRVRLNHGTCMQGRTVPSSGSGSGGQPSSQTNGVSRWVRPQLDWQCSWTTPIPKVEAAPTAAAAQFPQTLSA